LAHPPTEPDRAETDRAHMRAALALARRGLGEVWPNPAVGCVIVAGDRVVGRGCTAAGGRPHAETEALAMAGDAAKGGTAYVTLEPCAHHGKTPPCAEALIAAGIVRVVSALRDPDPRVSGRGVEILRRAGVTVAEGVLEAEARDLNAGFLSRIERGRPLVTLKLASTLDGRIATHTGESRWITGPAARAHAHLLRAENDAVMIGSGTALADDPELTCRLPGLGSRSPVRIVFDGRLRMPLTHRLAATADDVPTWVVTLAGGDRNRARAFAAAGIELFECPPGPDGAVDPAAALAALGSAGLTRILVEGGAHLAAALVRADLVDRLIWFRAARIVGGDGLAALVGFGVDRLSQTPRFGRVDVRPIGDDLMETYSRI